MFIRRNKNKSGSVSIQIVIKVNRRNKVLKTVGVARTLREEELLVLLANQEIQRLSGIRPLFAEHDDLVVEGFVKDLENGHIRTVGPELILGRIYQKMGLPLGGSRELLKHLIICRIVSPGSKLRTVEYLRKQGIHNLSVYSVYRYLDTLNDSLKEELETAVFKHSKSLLNSHVGVVFYDMTTLYFEASSPDDYRIPGYNKDGKHQHPQILVGLLISSSGLPLGYQVFEGNKAETTTLIPVLKSFGERFGVEKPIVVADAALLSKKNLEALTAGGYEFILGGRIRNESTIVKDDILNLKVTEGEPKELPTNFGRLIISYSSKRARKDLSNREKGLQRLENKVKTGRLSKEHINNRGYNKYLKIDGRATISIDYELFNKETFWDGLKGYVTNTQLKRKEVIEHYSQLWQIEKAFRISKTDLRIRPIYHRLKERIEAHLSICFAAYALHNELCRIMQKNELPISPEKAIEEIKGIKSLSYKLPKSGELKQQILKPNESQKRLLNLEF